MTEDLTTAYDLDTDDDLGSCCCAADPFDSADAWAPEEPEVYWPEPIVDPVPEILPEPVATDTVAVDPNPVVSAPVGGVTPAAGTYTGSNQDVADAQNQALVTGQQLQQLYRSERNLNDVMSPLYTSGAEFDTSSQFYRDRAW